jgi:hypothetical protein
VVTAENVLDTSLLLNRQAHRLYVYGFAAFVPVGIFVWFAGHSTSGLVFAAICALFFALNWTRGPAIWLIRRGRARAAIGKECEIRLTEIGVWSNQAGTTTETSWSALTGLVEDRAILILMKGSLPAYGIPKGAFGSEAELQEFRSFALIRFGRPAQVGVEHDAAGVELP